MLGQTLNIFRKKELIAGFIKKRDGKFFPRLANGKESKIGYKRLGSAIAESFSRVEVDAMYKMDASRF